MSDTQRRQSGFAIVVGLTCVGVFALALGARVRDDVPAPTAGQATLAPDALRVHLRGETFTPITKVADLPAGVREALTGLFGGSALELAEPGARFQATDVMVMPRLPARRLIAAGCSADHCLVYYERGGFAHVHQIVLLNTASTPARLDAGGLAAAGLESLDQVKDALMSGHVADGSKYW